VVGGSTGRGEVVPQFALGIKQKARDRKAARRRKKICGENYFNPGRFCPNTERAFQ